MTRGTVDGKTVATARLVVEAFQLADRYPHRAATHDYLMRKMRQQFERVASGTPEDPAYAGLSMRWLWIDRFVEFVRGQRSVAIKNVSLTEEPLSELPAGLPGAALLADRGRAGLDGRYLGERPAGFSGAGGAGQGQQGRVPPAGLAGRPAAVLRGARRDRSPRARSSAARATSVTNCRPKWNCSWRTSATASKKSKEI